MREIELVKNQSVVESNTNKNGMKLNTSRSHGILAGFFDFFFIVLAIGAILGLLTTIIGKTFFDSAIKSTLSALIIYIFAISSIVIYYLKFSKKVLWLSPGERIAGKIIVEGEKKWINPYLCNRWALFLLMILTVFIIGNEWDSVFQGYILTIWMIIVKLLRITLIFIGFALIGKGNLKGSWILIFLFLFGGFSWYYYLYLGEYELASITLILNGTLFILYIVIPLIYRLIRIVKLKKMY